MNIPALNNMYPYNMLPVTNITATYRIKSGRGGLAIYKDESLTRLMCDRNIVTSISFNSSNPRDYLPASFLGNFVNLDSLSLNIGVDDWSLLPANVPNLRQLAVAVQVLPVTDYMYYVPTIPSLTRVVCNGVRDDDSIPNFSNQSANVTILPQQRFNTHNMPICRYIRLASLTQLPGTYWVGVIECTDTNNVWIRRSDNISTCINENVDLTSLEHNFDCYQDVVSVYWQTGMTMMQHAECSNRIVMHYHTIPAAKRPL